MPELIWIIGALAVGGYLGGLIQEWRNARWMMTCFDTMCPRCVGKFKKSFHA